MCGIAGIISYRTNSPQIKNEDLINMQRSMISRGPDGKGLWISNDNKCALTHRRLAIQDLSDKASQPMLDINNGNQIVFNGEIYNFKILRNLLINEGYKFYSNSDTEVLLKLYATKGRKMVSYLRGMFSFAIWDNKKKGIFMARDSFGIKPLYITDTGEQIIFASQVKTIISSKLIEKSIDEASKVAFFLWGHIPEPRTLYKKIKSFKAGHTLWIDLKNNREEKSFFNINREIFSNENSKSNITRSESIDLLRQSLIDSINNHLISDVPVGLFLSAGLDSSTLLSFMKDSINPQEINAITLAFSEYKDTLNDESLYASSIAKDFNVKHTTKYLSQIDFQSNYEFLIHSMDQPTIDGVNTFFVCMAAKEYGLKVAISGLGADELFGGYKHFQTIPKLVKLNRLVNLLNLGGANFRNFSNKYLKKYLSPKYRSIFEMGGSIPDAYLLTRSLFLPWEIEEFVGHEIFHKGINKLNTISKLDDSCKYSDNFKSSISSLDIQWYMRNQLLRDTDWASMAHSIEVRVPFLDLELIKTLSKISSLGRSLNKKDMINSTKENFSNRFKNRKKTGFNVPINEWLNSRSKFKIKNEFSNHPTRKWAFNIANEFRII